MDLLSGQIGRTKRDGRAWLRFATACLGAVFVAACASNRTEAHAPTGPMLARNESWRADGGTSKAKSGQGGGSSGGSSSCAARAPSGALRRPSLERTLDRGLGSWLRGVDIEPYVVSGRFSGWILRSVYPDDPCYRDLDLRTGDVVTKVNGRSIERPEQAHDVWLALRRANALVVDYRRGPALRRIEIPIVEQ